MNFRDEWSPDVLHPWLTALSTGHIAAAPAEGAYGYVADALSETSLQSLIDAKQRDAGKGLICLIAHPDQLIRLCPPLPATATQAITQYWPCPPEAAVTLVLPALPSLPTLLTGGRTTIAVRCPATPYMQAYLTAWQQASGHGVLVSSSLNLSGEPPATRAAQIPSAIPALTLPQPLSGRVSRIFDPLQNRWLR